MFLGTVKRNTLGAPEWERLLEKHFTNKHGGSVGEAHVSDREH